MYMRTIGEKFQIKMYNIIMIEKRGGETYQLPPTIQRTIPPLTSELPAYPGGRPKKIRPSKPPRQRTPKIPY